MTTARSSEEDLTSLNQEELKSLYHKINTRLAKGLLNGASLEDQQENIRMLNKIAEELNRRKGFSGTIRNAEETIRP
ncbi:MAG TPA: hypothetical protein VL095_04405 [Flavisolibacter sp.]|nr:hypothetical protein [Flavisolibacter sp.]